MDAFTDLAVDTLSHITGESPVINAEKEFDRFIKSYDFAIEAQKLKREDIEDLMKLVVDRMSMYHLIAALLLDFCIGYYNDFTLLEEGYSNEPRVTMEFFLLSNIAAIGYLIFAVWLSLHASVAAHAIGVELRLDHTRLTIPTPENLRQMREATSIFRSVYKTFFHPLKKGTTVTEDTPELEEPVAPLSLDSLDVGAGHSVLPPRLHKGFHKLDHRAKFAEGHRAWLRFDAYSRVCMALGINQMLQSLSYFIVGPIQKSKPSFALLSVVGIQTIAFCLLKLDIRTTDHRNYTAQADPEDEDDEDKKDPSRIHWGELGSVIISFVLPPIWMVLVLWMCHFMGDQSRMIARTLTAPLFFLHALWLYLVWDNIKPDDKDSLPIRLRTVGYLEVFTRDANLGKEGEEQIDLEVPALKARRREGYKPTKQMTTALCSADEDRQGASDEEIDFEEPKRGMTPRIWSRNITLASGGGRLSVEQRKKAKKTMRGHDEVAWMVVGRFTMSMIALWIVGGVVHIINCALDVEGIKPRLDGEREEEEEPAIPKKDLQALSKLRQLRATWPEPQRLFEVTALHCNSSNVVVSSPFSSFAAELPDEASLGKLAPLAGVRLTGMLCGSGNPCEGLAQVREGSWHLVQLPASLGELPQRSEVLPIPVTWRVATAVRMPCEVAPCHAAALLAGWNGHQVMIADLLQERVSTAWQLKRRFTVDEGLGRCPRSSNASKQAGAQGAQAVQALHLHVGAGCRTLAVLRGGVVEGWDVVSGVHLGCWRARRRWRYSAFCYDGSRMLLARHGSRGPVLESAELPQALAKCGNNSAHGE